MVQRSANRLVVTLVLGLALATWAVIALTDDAHQGDFVGEGVSDTGPASVDATLLVAAPDAPSTEPPKIDLPDTDALFSEEPRALKASLSGWAGRPLEFRGRVVDVSGQPLPEATVVWVPSRATWSGSGHSSRPELKTLSTTTSDEAGRFVMPATFVRSRPDSRFPLWSEDGTQLVVMASGFLRATPVVLKEDAFFETDSRATHVIDVGDVRLLPEGRIIGRVVDQQGMPVEGVPVAPRYGRTAFNGPEAPAGGLQPGVGAVSGPDGRFVIGGQWTHQTTYRVGARRLHEVFVEVAPEPGKTFDMGDVVLSFAGSLAGRVLDDKGEPVAGADVLVQRAAWKDDMKHGNQHHDRLSRELHAKEGAVAVTGPDGRFMVDQIYGPSQRVLVGAPWYDPAYVHGVETGTQDLELTLLPGARALIAVVDAQTGRSLPGAEVKAFWDVGFGTDKLTPSVVGAAEEHDGQHVVPAQLARFTQSVYVARHPGYAETRLEVKGAEPGSQVPVTLELQPGVRLTGLVKDSGGRPVPDVWVRCTKSEEKPSEGPWSTATDDGGRFAFAELPPGNLTLSVAGLLEPGQAPGPVMELTVAGGERREGLVLSFVPSGRVTGRLLKDEEERGHGHVLLKSGSSGRMDLGTVADGDDGHFVFEEVSPGEWEARCCDETAMSIVVVPGEVVDVELSHAKSSWLTGQVIERGTGRPVPGVRIAQAAHDPFPSANIHTADFVTLSGDDGRFASVRRNLGWFDQEELKIYTQVPGGQLVAQRGLERPVDESVDLVLEVGGASLSLLVVDGLTGAPVPGAQIRLGREELRAIDGVEIPQWMDATTDEMGAVSLDWLEPGRWPVRVASSGYVPSWTALDLSEGDNEATVSARVGASLEGLMTLEDGTPLWEGSRVGLYWEGAEGESDETYRTLDVEGGRFAAEDLTPGLWRIKAWGEAMDARTVLWGREGREFELVSGESLFLELVVLDEP